MTKTYLVTSPSARTKLVTAANQKEAVAKANRYDHVTYTKARAIPASGEVVEILHSPTELKKLRGYGNDGTSYYVDLVKRIDQRGERIWAKRGGYRAGGTLAAARKKAERWAASGERVLLVESVYAIEASRAMAKVFSF